MSCRAFARRFFLPLLATGIVSGCQTGQLRIGSINQALSYGDIQEQQVLDNVAKFVYDINSLPSFAFSAQGNHQVQDQVSIGSTTLWQRVGGGLYSWFSSTATPAAQRQAYQSWVLQPLNDPRKLELMRCAYQKVVRANLAARRLPEPAGCCPPCDGGVCPDCAQRFNTFYTGKPTTPTPPPGDPQDTGVVTHLCLGHNPIWFAWGCKKDVPKHCRCLKCGHYCGVYVWVLPGGEDELTKLTLAILDYAVNAPAQPVLLTREVTYTVDRNGQPTADKNQAVATVKGVLPINTPGLVLLKADLAHAAGTHTNMQMRQTLANTVTSIPPAPNLRGPYRPSIDEVGGATLLQLQGRLQASQPIPTLGPPISAP